MTELVKLGTEEFDRLVKAVGDDLVASVKRHGKNFSLTREDLAFLLCNINTSFMSGVMGYKNLTPENVSVLGNMIVAQQMRVLEALMYESLEQRTMQ